jgi:putative membrane protein
MMSKKMVSLALGCAMAVLSPAMFGQSSDDKAFVKHAAEGGWAEIEMGKLAEQKASSPEVKQFGPRMVVDHTKLNEDMKPVAMKMGVSVPTSPSVAEKAKYEELKMKSGPAFDKAYMKAMVEDHQKDLDEFNTEYNNTKYEPLKMTVGKGKSVIAEHKQMADSIAHKMGVS